MVHRFQSIAIAEFPKRQIIKHTAGEERVQIAVLKLSNCGAKIPVHAQGGSRLERDESARRDSLFHHDVQSVKPTLLGGAHIGCEFLGPVDDAGADVACKVSHLLGVCA